ncbi:hypothetical protein CCUS01_01791, partial [Colletotrichum cuscutae]
SLLKKQPSFLSEPEQTNFNSGVKRYLLENQVPGWLSPKDPLSLLKSRGISLPFTRRHARWNSHVSCNVMFRILESRLSIDPREAPGRCQDFGHGQS